MPPALRSVLSRIAALFTLRRGDRDLDAEIEAHLSLLADRLVRQGMTPEEARYAARKQFGGITQLWQEHRELRGFAWLETLWRDIAQSFRALMRKPSFTVTAVVTIALGIGANTAVYSVADAVLLRPLRAPHADQIVRLLNRYPEGTLGDEIVKKLERMRASAHPKEV